MTPVSAEFGAAYAVYRRGVSTDPFLICKTYYGLKDYDPALEWLRRAIDDRNLLALMSARVPNAWPGLSELPGYANLLAHFDSLQRSP